MCIDIYRYIYKDPSLFCRRIVCHEPADGGQMQQVHIYIYIDINIYICVCVCVCVRACVKITPSAGAGFYAPAERREPSQKESSLRIWGCGYRVRVSPKQPRVNGSLVPCGRRCSVCPHTVRRPRLALRDGAATRVVSLEHNIYKHVNYRYTSVNALLRAGYPDGSDGRIFVYM